MKKSRLDNKDTVQAIKEKTNNFFTDYKKFHGMDLLIKNFNIFLHKFYHKLE